jgi:hypothetical protein
MIVDVKKFELHNLNVIIEAVFEKSGQQKLYRTNFVCRNIEQYDELVDLPYGQDSFDYIESLKLEWLLIDDDYKES